jgi:hypothetical protein
MSSEEFSMPTLPAPPMPGYDDAEALDLLNRVSDRLSRNVKARSDAVGRLLDALVSLDGRVRGVRFSRPFGEDAVTVTANNLSVEVAHDGDGGITVYDREGSKRVPRVYTTTKGILESQNPDTFCVPKPGEPVARRSALAEVLEVALRMLKAL